MNPTLPRITLGIDLGDKRHAICILNQTGEVIEERFMSLDRDSSRRLSQSFPGVCIVMEVGGSSENRGLGMSET
jgi:hypothetical protein